MSEQDTNKALCRRFYGAITTADESTLVAVCAPTARFRVMGQDLDFAQHLGLTRGFAAAFSDAQIVLDEMIAEGDRVFTRGHFSGRHTASFQGIPATGREVRVPTLGFHRVQNGRVVEHAGELSVPAFMAQLGVGAPPR